MDLQIWLNEAPIKNPAPRYRVKCLGGFHQGHQNTLTWHLGAGFRMVRAYGQKAHPPLRPSVLPAPCYQRTTTMKSLNNRNTFPALQTTGALCKAANVTRGQLRLYEEAGLIKPRSRTQAGYRQYGLDMLDRLKVIMHLKELGLTLGDIALLLSDRDNGLLDANALQRLATDVLSKIDARIASLHVIRGYLAPVATGDMRVLQDEDCSFVLAFMTAMSAHKARSPGVPS